MEEKCGSAAICFVAFLPDILDSKAEGRDKYIRELLSAAEKFKKSPYRLVSWSSYHSIELFSSLIFTSSFPNLLIVQFFY